MIRSHKDQLDLVTMPLEHGLGFDSVCRFQHRVAEFLEHGAGHLADGSIVLDQENGFAPGRDFFLLAARCFFYGLRLQGQIDAENGPGAGCTGNVNKAVVLFDDTVSYGQAEPGPFTHFLGGEEGLKDVCLDIHVHARAAVGNRYDGI